MSDRFPDDHELVGFFEAEPAVLTPGQPWIYNRLTFETERYGIGVVCEIKPSYGWLRLRLVLAGRDLIDIELQDIIAVQLESRAGLEALRATVHGPHRREDVFVLQLKPHLRVAWGSG